MGGGGAFGGGGVSESERGVFVNRMLLPSFVFFTPKFGGKKGRRQPPLPTPLH